MAEKAKNIPPFVRFCAASVPMAFDNSLSYYECLCALTKKLQEIVDVVNVNAEQLQGLQDSFNELKSYVDNYFDNLDVQAEINAKLDEMAEGGELASIIAEFLAMAPVFGYATVAAMVAAENITAGNIAKTAGFYAAGDKGGAYYNIVDTIDGTADGRKIIALDNDLYAILIEDANTTVNQYGAYGDGVHDDYDAIQYAIENNLFGTVKFADATYAIGDTLKTYNDNSKKTSFILEPTTTIKALSPLDALIELGGLGGESSVVTNRFRAIVGGIFDATDCTAAIALDPAAMGCEIIRAEIINAGTYGIYIPRGSGSLYSSDTLIDQCNISCTSSADSTTAIYCERPDNKIVNTKLNACKKGFYFSAGGQTIINVHGLQVGAFTGTTFIHFASGGLNFVTDSYCDSFQTFIQNDTDGEYTLTNSAYYSYVTNKNATLFKFASPNPRCTIANNSFNMPVPESSHKGIVFTGTFYSILQAYTQMIVKDNLITRTSNFTPGDLLLNLNDYVPFWTNTDDLSTTQWVKLGYVTSGTIYYNLVVNVAGKIFNANFKLERYSGTTYLTNYATIKSDSNYSIKLGFKYVGNDNGYPVYALYLQQVSGTTQKADIAIHNNNTLSPFIPERWPLRNVSLVTETMDANYTL